MILLAALLCNYGHGFCLIDVGTEGSQIVHEGTTGVANDEMYLIYLYCMAALHALVLSPVFSHMRSNADLDEWFRDRVLEAPDYVHDERT
jgi:hypothetical protein